MERCMENTGAVKDVVKRHLFDAIEQVRVDVEKVEFWASAVAGFGLPVPDYNPAEMRVWLPHEQATRLDSSN